MFILAHILGGSHGRASVGLLLVIIRLVAHSDFLFHELPEPFAVNDQAGWRRWRRGVPDDLCHVAEKPGGAEQDRWITILLHVIKEKLRVLVALGSRQSQPLNSRFPVLFYLIAQQIQLAQDVLCL